MGVTPPRPIRTVLVYHDADAHYVRAFETHLAPLCREGLLTLWHRGKISAGEDQEAAIERQFNQAQLILLLVSADLNSGWDDRLSSAVHQARSNDVTRIIPVALRACIWDGQPFYGLQPVPKDGSHLVSNGTLLEERIHAAAAEIRSLVARLRPEDPPLRGTRENSVLFAIAELERARILSSTQAVRAAAATSQAGTATRPAGAPTTTTTASTSPSTSTPRQSFSTIPPVEVLDSRPSIRHIDIGDLRTSSESSKPMVVDARSLLAINIARLQRALGEEVNGSTEAVILSIERAAATLEKNSNTIAQNAKTVAETNKVTKEGCGCLIWLNIIALAIGGIVYIIWLFWWHK